jgi:predicted nucleic acid-binding protein
MVLVDTSVWIRFLANVPPFAAELDRLLDADEVVGHDLVAGELLIGDRSGRGKLLEAYAQMHQAKTVAHSEVVELVRARRLSGVGLGWIDAHLLASAVLQRHHVWTTDSSLAAAAAALGVGYRPAVVRAR